MVALLSPVSGTGKLLSEFRVLVLLCMPDLRVLLGSNFEGSGVKLLNDRVNILVSCSQRLLGKIS